MAAMAMLQWRSRRRNCSYGGHGDAPVAETKEESTESLVDGCLVAVCLTQNKI